MPFGPFGRTVVHSTGMSITSFTTDPFGVTTRARLRAAGLGERAIRALVDRGKLAPHRNLLVTPSADPKVAHAVALGAKVACVSAARLRGLWVADEGLAPHVSVAANTPRRFPDDVRVHWTARPLDRADRLGVESGRNMLLHVAQCQPTELAVCVFDSAVNKRLITIEELRRLAAVRGGRFAAVVRLADGRADSGLESLMRVRLQAQGVDSRLQVKIAGHRVDLLIGDWLVLQADGWQFHQTSRQRDEDLAHDRRLVQRGYTVLRYPYSAIMGGWGRAEAEILAQLAAGADSRPSRH